MKVAHYSIFAPNRCGLYHTAKELVLAERLVGIDAGLIAYDEKEICKDGSFTSEKHSWADDADILVRHSAIPDAYHNSGKPIVLMLHGRPESSMRLEAAKLTPVISMLNKKIVDERYKKFVTLWPEYVDIWSSIVPQDKMGYCPSMVDLTEFKPGNKKFELGKHKGKYNILISDLWRDDVTPFNIIFSAVKFAKQHEGTKIHIVACGEPELGAMIHILASLRASGFVGLISGQTRNIKELYSACDMFISPHVIATRSIRESLACGLKVVAGEGCKYTPFTASHMDINGYADAIERCYNGKMDSRKIAEDNFGFEQAGNAMKLILEDTIRKEKNTRRKVFIDIGGHIGETVRRFFREVKDADEYDIHSFEPDYPTFKTLDENTRLMKNVNLVNACVGTEDGMVDFFVGKHNNNEGGTTILGKKTGGVNYKKPTKVECIDLARWLKENIGEDDFVILKINIEGGEYKLMQMLLDKDLTGLIDRCHIQLHAHKFDHGEQRQRFQKIESDFWNNAKCEKFLTNKGFFPFNATKGI